MKFISFLKRINFRFPIIFIALILLSSLFLYYSHTLYLKEKYEITEGYKQELGAIAQLKADQVINWRLERLNDAAIMFDNETFKRLGTQYFRNPHSKEILTKLVSWFEPLLKSSEYTSIDLINNKYKLYNIYGNDLPCTSDDSSNIDKALSNKKILFSDLYLNDNKPIFSLIVPYFQRSNKNDSVFLFAALMRISPDSGFFQMVETWPGRDNNSENLIVERRGDSLVYLSRLKFLKDATLKLKISIKDTNRFDVQVVRGKILATCLDYRKTPIIGAYRKIEGTNWYLITKTDLTSIEKMIREKAKWFILFNSFMVLFTIALFLIAWDRRKSMHLKHLLKTQRALDASENKFYSLYSNMEEGVAFHTIVFDQEGRPVNYRIDEVNERYVEITGCKRDDAIGKLATEIYQSDEAPYLDKYYNSVIKQTAERFEAYFEPMGIYFDISVVPRGDDGFATIFSDITLKKKNEIALKESEARYKNLFNNAQVGLFRTTIDTGKIIACNETFARMAGYSSTEQCCREYITTEHYVDKDLRNKVIQQLLAEKSVSGIEAEFTDKHGNPIWVQYAVKLFETENFIEGALIDISTRKQAEENLYKSEEKLRDIFSNIRDVYYEITLEGIILEISPSIKYISLYEREEFIGKSILSFYADPDSRLQFIEQLKANGAVDDYEISMFNKNGAKVRCSISARLVMNNDGKPKFIVGSLRNIEERKKAEDERKKLETQYSELFINANDIIITADFNAHVTSINPAAERILGFSPDEIIGKCLSKFVTQSSYTKILQNIKDKLTNINSATNYEIQALHKNGGLVHLQVNSFLRSSDNKAPSEVFAIVRDISESINAKNNLLKSEEKYRNIFNNIQDCYFETIPDRTITEVSPSIDKISSYTREELIGKDILSFYAIPEQRDQFISLLLQKGSVIDYEIILTDKGKKQVHCTVSASVIKNSDGIPVKFVGSMRNIDERKKIENQIIESEKRYRFISENTADIIWMREPETLRYTYISPSVERSRGFTVEEAMQQNLDQVLSPESYKVIIENFRTRMKSFENGDESARIQTEIVEQNCKNGNTILSEVVTTLLTSDNGKVNGILGVSRDITERRRNEEKIRESEEKYRSIFNSFIDVYYELSMDGTIITISPSCYAMSGYKAEDIIGKNIMDTGQYPEQQQLFLEKILKDGSVYDYEIPLKLKNGEQAIVSVSSHLKFDRNNTPISIEGVIRDITERKKTVDEIIKAKEEAELANRSKSEFLANISHETRTPLNGIIGLSEILLESAVNDEQKENLELLMNSADDLLSILNDLLDVSAMESGKLEIIHEPFSLNEVVQKSIHILSHKIEIKGLSINSHIDQAIPTMLIGDGLRIRQLIYNLVGNAIKYTPSGSINISVISKGIEKSRHWVQFCIKDTGIGIPREKIGEIFEAFKQVDSSLKRKYSGVGLGLAISKKLVELMDGKIWVESEVGKGSSFYFEIGLMQHDLLF